MEFSERERLIKKVYYHEGCFLYYKNKLISCREEEKENILKNIEKEENIIYNLST